MMWAARPDFSCEYASRAWLAFTGAACGQAAAEAWARAIHPEDLPRWLATCVSAFDAHAPYLVEYRVRRTDGAMRWVRERGVPRGGGRGYFSLCTDLGSERPASPPGACKSFNAARELQPPGVLTQKEASHELGPHPG